MARFARAPRAGNAEELAALRAEVERLRGALEGISVQRTTEQIAYDERFAADFEFAYNEIVGVARAALAKEPRDEG